MTMKNDLNNKSPLSIVDLFPDLKTEEQAAAEYAFKQYLYLVWRICERVSVENPALLTQSLREANVKKKNSKASVRKPRNAIHGRRCKILQQNYFLRARIN